MACTLYGLRCGLHILRPKVWHAMQDVARGAASAASAEAVPNAQQQQQQQQPRQRAASTEARDLATAECRPCSALEPLRVSPGWAGPLSGSPAGAALHGPERPVRARESCCAGPRELRCGPERAAVRAWRGERVPARLCAGRE